MSLYCMNREGVRLGIIARTRGNDWLSDAIRMLRHGGVETIVSALTAPEVEEPEPWYRSNAFQLPRSHSLSDCSGCR